MLQESSALIIRERDRVEQQAMQANARLEQLELWVALASLIAVVLAGVLALRTTRSVVKPLAQLEAAARRIAAGDYASALQVTRVDEIDRVSEALATMAAAIAAREAEIGKLAFFDPLTELPNRTFLLQPLVNQQAPSLKWGTAWASVSPPKAWRPRLKKPSSLSWGVM